MRFICKSRSLMRKTLLKHFTEEISEKPIVMQMQDAKSDVLTDLVQDMKPYLQEAAADLLSPRPELMAQLFKRVLN